MSPRAPSSSLALDLLEFPAVLVCPSHHKRRKCREFGRPGWAAVACSAVGLGWDSYSLSQQVPKNARGPSQGITWHQAFQFHLRNFLDIGCKRWMPESSRDRRGNHDRQEETKFESATAEEIGQRVSK
jgi:hypothetical protein